jgi:hypothetical protein
LDKLAPLKKPAVPLSGGKSSTYPTIAEFATAVARNEGTINQILMVRPYISTVHAKAGSLFSEKFYPSVIMGL